MRHRIHLLSLFLVLSSLAFAKGHSGTHSTHASTSHSKKSKASSGKTEHVKGYYRKDGTYVQPYDRHPAGTAPGASSTTVPYRHGYIAEGFSADPTVQRDNHGRIKRSAAAKEAFKREHPCPSTGKSSGSCHGYVIDHVNPLECGGADTPSNMQWQTTGDAKAKDKTEGYCRSSIVEAPKGFAYFDRVNYPATGIERLLCNVQLAAKG